MTAIILSVCNRVILVRISILPIMVMVEISGRTLIIIDSPTIPVIISRGREYLSGYTICRELTRWDIFGRFFTFHPIDYREAFSRIGPHVPGLMAY